LSSADYSPIYKILLKPDAESTAAPACQFALTMFYIFLLTLIIGSDRRSETKQWKIVRFRSRLRHFRLIISCCRHFVRFVVNF